MTTTPRRQRAWLPFAATVVTVAATASVMNALDMEPDVPFVAAVVALLGALIWAYSSLQQSTVVPQRLPRAIASGPVDGADRSVRSIRSTIVFGRWLGSNQLHERLVAIIDDRLDLHHGIDRLAEPERAREVLGPDLRRFIELTGEDDRLPPVRELERIVDRIERL